MASDPPDSDRPDERDIESQAQGDIVDAIRKSNSEHPVKIPDDLAKVVASVVTEEIREIAISHQGPIPHPATLAEYDKVVPGLANRIALRPEKEQEFRHEIARYQIETWRRDLRHTAIRGYIGQAFGFLIAMTAVGGGIYLLANDKSTQGIASIISALAFLTVTFIGGKLADTWAEKGKESHDEPASDQGDDIE
ncbi:MAG: DUF2335 domain-containing protein [Pirellulales bacterium]